MSSAASARPKLFVLAGPRRPLPWFHRLVHCHTSFGTSPRISRVGSARTTTLMPTAAVNIGGGVSETLESFLQTLLRFARRSAQLLGEIRDCGIANLEKIADATIADRDLVREAVIPVVVVLDDVGAS